jgi:integrase
MSGRRRNHGLRKICGCGKARWPKCAHAWHFNFKHNRIHYRFSLDGERGQHLASRTDAENEATRIRAMILAGTFERAIDRRAREQREHEERANVAKANAGPSLTLDGFGKTYLERVSKASGKASWRDDQSLLHSIGNHAAGDGRRLGDWPLISITEDELEAFYASLVAANRAASTRNHYIQFLKAAFRWAAKKGYLARSPISDDSSLVRSKHAQRSRRVTREEESALLKAAHLIRRTTAVSVSGLIVGALETGCRLGELLALQWRDVDLDRREIRIRGENAKDGDTRRLPISTRLAPVLDMARTDPAANRYPDSAHVFGVLGQPVRTIKKAWETCVLRAHGHEPTWTQGGKLSEESRAALRVVDLHFHDLRHEAGSRWLEAGWPLHHVKEMLGHANISQTDTYLNAGRLGLHESMRRFDDQRCKNVASEASIDQRPVSNTQTQEATKDLLH